MSYRRWKQLGPRPRPGPRVALFPFLAVLICTMGALVPLLLAMARQARLSAQAEAQTRAADRATELNAQREAVQWRIEQLRSARQQTEAQWEKAQQYLGHLEDHSRRLEEEIGQLRRQHESLQQRRRIDQSQLDQLRAQCRQVEAELARAETEAAQPRPDSKPPRRSYALVPYVGPNRTQRRPIYLECTARAVIVQPEGIRLTVEDFDGPLGASNPLISVVRAAREQMVLSGALDPDRDGEPYPLLMVRPDGVAAYHYARIALKPWGPDFGYELISADLDLAYPPPDARLAEVMQTALAQARQVQARLIAAAPRSYGNVRRSHTARADDDPAHLAGTEWAGRAGDGAGLGGAPDYGPGRPQGAPTDPTALGLGGGPGINAGPGAAGRAGNAGAPGGAGVMAVPGAAGGGGLAGAAGMTGPAGRTAGLGASTEFGPQLGSPGGGGGPHAIAAGSPAAAAGLDGAGATVGASQPSPASPATIGAPGSSGSPDSTGNNPSTAAGHSGSGQALAAAGQRSAQRPSGSGQPALGGPPGTAGLLPGQWQEKPPGASSAEGDHSAQPGATERHASSSARSRNRPDWALPEAGPKSTGIVRPIRVELHADRMIVGLGADAKTIALPARTAAVTDELVAALWAQMESWGIAGKSAHWRPVLAVDVAPGADGRYADLTRMLEGSGVGVERRASARTEGGPIR